MGEDSLLGPMLAAKADRCDICLSLYEEAFQTAMSFLSTPVRRACDRTRVKHWGSSLIVTDRPRGGQDKNLSSLLSVFELPKLMQGALFSLERT